MLEWLVLRSEKAWKELGHICSLHFLYIKKIIIEWKKPGSKNKSKPCLPSYLHTPGQPLIVGLSISEMYKNSQAHPPIPPRRFKKCCLKSILRALEWTHCTFTVLFVSISVPCRHTQHAFIISSKEIEIIWTTFVHFKGRVCGCINFIGIYVC